MYSDKLPQIEHLTQDKIQRLTRLCKIRIYQPGEHVDVQTGGVLLRGGLSKLKKDGKNQSRKDQLM